MSVSFGVYYDKSNKSPWGKLASLANNTYPSYGSNGFFGTAVDVRIGNLYNASMIITSLSYSWDNESPWALSGDGGSSSGRPKYTTVDMDLTYLGSAKPEQGVKIFG